MIRFAAAVLLLLLHPVPAEAASVYKCVATDGSVEYSAKPCAGVPSEKLDISSESTDEAAVKARIENRKETIASLDETEARENAQSEKARKEQEERATLCKQARERLAKVIAARRIFENDGDERRYFSSEEIVAERQRAQDSVNELCTD